MSDAEDRSLEYGKYSAHRTQLALRVRSHIQHIYNGDARLQTDDYQNQTMHIGEFLLKCGFLTGSFFIYDITRMIEFIIMYHLLQTIHTNKGDCTASGEAWCSYS